MEGDSDGIDVGQSVTDGASLGLELGSDEGIADGRPETLGLSLGMDDGEVEILGASEGCIEARGYQGGNATK